MHLEQLIKPLDLTAVSGSLDREITQVVCDSRKVVPGSLFVCIRGYRTDGHAYIDDAIAAGARALVVMDPVDNCPLTQITVPDSRVALAALADTFYGHPSRALVVLGITATNGKTTTSFMVDEILRRHGLETGLIGTVMVKYKDVADPAYLTTPESIDLHRIFHQMKAAGVTHACMEVSSSALELSRVGQVDFDVVSLANISREHIDLHGSFEAYYAAKARLITEAKPGALAILNRDDPYSLSLAEKTAARVLTFGIDDGTGDFVAKDVDLSTGRARFTLEIPRPLTLGGVTVPAGTTAMTLATPGYHTVYNALVALVMGLAVGASLETIAEALAAFGGVERRFEMIHEGDFVVFDDHFANAGNIQATFNTLHKMDYRRLKILYAIRGSRGPVVIREAAEATVAWAERLGLEEVIATKSRSHVTWKDEVTDEELAIYSQIITGAGLGLRIIEELDDAVVLALGEIQKGDVLLLAGCQGMDYGAKICLEHLAERHPSWDREVLFRPLEKRVAGISELMDL